ncbi:MAG: hypothetical protein GW917_02545 [Bdellovibrionales bacterium]|nr:hypothetical protein [Bdellovibrionales bacterium]
MGTKKIDTSIQDGANLIVLPNVSEKDLFDLLETSIKQWLILPEKVHAFDFANVSMLDQACITQLLGFQKSLKKVEKSHFSLNINPNLTKLLKEKGLLTAFNIKKSFEDGLNRPSEKAAPGQKVDARLLKPFIDGAANAFQVQVGITLKSGTPSSKTHIFEESDAIAGQVEISLPNFKGQISLCFSKEGFIGVYEALLGEKITQIDEESADAASELLNMIYGHAKTILNKDFGMVLEPALPKAIINPKPLKSTHPVIVIPFDSDQGKLRIEIVIY